MFAPELQKKSIGAKKLNFTAQVVGFEQKAADDGNIYIGKRDHIIQVTPELKANIVTGLGYKSHYDVSNGPVDAIEFSCEGV